MLKTTIEQWELVQAVVRHGSVAKAAEACHRSQPALSYQLNQLQQRLGVAIFSLKGRRLELNETGKELLAQAETLIDGWRDLELKAESLHSGARSVIKLVIDSIFPKSQLFDALKAFSQCYPKTQVHIKEIVRHEGFDQVKRESGDLYVICLDDDVDIGRQFLMDVRFVLVAKHDHPIFGIQDYLQDWQLSDYPLIQIVEKDDRLLDKQRKAQGESWCFTSVESAKDAILNQLGYGWLPQYRIQSLLDSGELRQLNDSRYPARHVSLYLVKNPATQHDRTINCLSDMLMRALTV